MIRVSRGAEPPESKLHRLKKMAKAITAFNEHGDASKQLNDALSDYDRWKELIFLAHHKKCAYCERRAYLSNSPLEHFRPKRGAIRTEWRQKPQQIDASHYWWLTWTWENHLFACPRCNGQDHKGNYFQVEPGTACACPVGPVYMPAPDPLVSVAAEVPLFIDPSDPGVDPLDLLWWEPLNASLPPRTWVWVLRWNNARGRITAANLQLEDLAGDIGAHVRENIVPRVEVVLGDAQSGNLGQARTRWSDLLAQKLLNPQADFRGPTWKALDLLVPAADRATWGLAAPPRP